VALGKALNLAKNSPKCVSPLFDTGPGPLVFSRNARLLKVDFGAIDAPMLSHGHWDHGGGILKALDLIAAAGGKPQMPVHMHPGMFARRALRAADGTMRQMRDVPKPAEIAKRDGRAILKREAYAALDGFFWISGEIPRVTPFERGMPGQHRRTLHVRRLVLLPGSPRLVQPFLSRASATMLNATPPMTTTAPIRTASSGTSS